MNTVCQNKNRGIKNTLKLGKLGIDNQLYDSCCDKVNLKLKSELKFVYDTTICVRNH